MNQQTWLAGLVGFLIGVFIIPVFLPVRSGDHMGWGMMMGGRWFGSRSVLSPGAENFDGHFIRQMISHHEDAVTMADIALEKAEHKEIRELAQNIIRTQSEEIKQMKRWYKDWYGSEISLIPQSPAHGMMNMGMMGDITDIDRLENAEPFDQEFIRQMISHHQMAVMMAEMLLQSAPRPELETLARDIIAAQTAEITTMRQWYQDWYGK